MKRSDLEHIIRASAAITNEYEIVVIGSQSILGSAPQASGLLVLSMEADLYPLRRPELADLIDGSMGEDSPFNDRFGYYAQGVGPETAVLPQGWQDRLVKIQGEGTDLRIGYCLEPHDLAASKLVAGREKDAPFVQALFEQQLIRLETLRERIDALPVASDRMTTLSRVAQRLHDQAAVTTRAGRLNGGDDRNGGEGGGQGRHIGDTDEDPRPARKGAFRLESIVRATFADHDRQTVHDAAIRAVQADPAGFLDRYALLPKSHGGRYVCADLFKELFPAFAAGPDGRNRYNTPVHNPAAVLASAQFTRNLEAPVEAGSTVLFLTGVPGSGKTTTVLGNGMPPDTHMVYEGQLARPETTFPKIDAVLAAGLQPHIHVVHVPAERALLRTLQRFHDEGRGASVQTMAAILGGTPDGLAAVRDKYGDRVRLTIRDERDPVAIHLHQGWKQLDILRSEGTREPIEERLRTIVDELHEQRRIPAAAWRHARGLAPERRPDARTAADDRLGDQVRRDVQKDDGRSRVPGSSAPKDPPLKRPRDPEEPGPQR